MERPRHPVNAGAAPTRARGAARLALAAAIALALPACSVVRSPEVARGNRPTEEQLKDINVGVHTRADVQAILGSPTASSTFGDGSWYYISSRTRQAPARFMTVREPETLVVDFDGRGVVREIRRLREGDMRPVQMVSRETPTPGNERTLLQALFGNIGRFGPGALGSSQPGGPGAPAPGTSASGSGR